MKTLFVAVILVFSLLFSQQGFAKRSFAIKAVIESGVIEGNFDTQSRIQRYFGIPYAKPPTGDLRWKAPRPVEPWEGVRQTMNFGPSPVQAPVFGDMSFRASEMSEDCLYLNVWTPADRNTTGLPVLVYFHGGGFSAGDGSEPRYDGESMARKGIVVVTINYRLNVFGFLAHPGLSAEAPHHASGNYGLLDQVAALEWVNRNIGSFGGDSRKVTIAGESAGSISVSYHMASPLSKQLIAGGIGESGAGIFPTDGPVPLKEAEKTGVEFLEKAGYSNIAKFRALPTRDIYEIFLESKRFGFPVVLDNYFLPRTLPEVFEAGEQAQIPLLVGWNSAEIGSDGFMQREAREPVVFRAKVKETWPEAYAEAFKVYPHSTAEEVEQSATDLASDRFIVYSTWKWFDLHRRNSNQAVYRYLYDKIRPPLVSKTLDSALAGGTVEKEEGLEEPVPIGAGHSWEIEYCMGNLYLTDKTYAWHADDYKTSETMQGFFANFIKTGDPNGTGLPDWPKASPGSPDPPVMLINTESRFVPARKDARFEFLDRQYQGRP